MMKNLSIALVLLCSCSTSSEERKKEDSNTGILAFQPETGKIYPMQYEFSVYNDSTGDYTDFVAGFSAEVKESGSEKVVVLLHYDSIGMKAHINGADIQLNASDKPKEESEATVLAAPIFAYLDKSFETTYDARHNKLNEKQVRQTVDSSVVAAESKIQFVGRYPKKELKPGDTWVSEDPIRIGSNEIKSMRYTVKEMTATETVLDLWGEINSAGEKFGREFRVIGELKGTVRADRKTGWQNQTLLNIHFVLEMGDKRTPMRQKISFSLK